MSAVSDVIVDLIVNPVNDIDPIFDLTPYTTTLTENRAFGSFVYAPTPLELDVIDDLLNFQSYVCSKVGMCTLFKFFNSNRNTKQTLCIVWFVKSEIISLKVTNYETYLSFNTRNMCYENPMHLIYMVLF